MPRVLTPPKLTEPLPGVAVNENSAAVIALDWVAEKNATLVGSNEIVKE